MKNYQPSKSSRDDFESQCRNKSIQTPRLSCGEIPTTNSKTSVRQIVCAMIDHEGWLPSSFAFFRIFQFT